jgi:two-component system, response regulator PdtaR
MHVLIIEDEMLTALQLSEILDELGFESHEIAATQEEAIAAANRQCPDLITADVRLQTGNGVAAVRSICAKRYIPVIYITGSRSELAYDRTAVIVDKPFTDDSIRAAVETAMRAPPGLPDAERPTHARRVSGE